MKKVKNYKLIISGLFSAITVLCAWLTIPTAVPFTMQTLAVFLTAQLLPVQYSLLSVAVYIGLGVVGLPVFSGITALQDVAMIPLTIGDGRDERPMGNLDVYITENPFL